MNRAKHCSACVIGAGPYGLSISAHLSAKGVHHRVFGKIMRRWRDQMPKGMFLKSEGFASSLSEPSGQHTLRNFCAKENLPYGERGVPVSREIFVNYALSFQRQFAPHVEQEMVSAVDMCRDGFEVALESGEKLTTSRVIVATGMDPVLPAELEKLPNKLRSHAADHSDLSDFGGKTVLIVGAGQSALETAALLLDEGASPIVLARSASLVWNEPPDVHPSFFKRLRHPRSPLGDGLMHWLIFNYPGFFRRLQRDHRMEIVSSMLGPAGAWWLRKKLEGRLPVHFGQLLEASPQGNGVTVKYSAPNGQMSEIIADHIIAGTGYCFDVHGLPFLRPRLKSALRTEGRLPLLSADFECSAPGLYFAGLASAYMFGPSMRFICGTRYAAERISAHIAASKCRHGSEPAQPSKYSEEPANI